MPSATPSVKKGFLFWSLPALGAIAFIWIFQAVLLPFVIGIALAYLLNPCVNALHKWGLSRAFAALGILISFIAFVVLCLALGIPVLVREIADLMKLAPDLMEQAWDKISTYAGSLPEGSIPPEPPSIPNLLSSSTAPAATAAEIGKTIMGWLATGGAYVGGMAGAAVFAPIVAYFMVKEWPAFTAWIEDLIPPLHRGTILDLMGKMDHKISGFVRGQLIVASVLAVGYALTLFAMGLNYGILIGLVAGILNLVPLLGSITGLIAGASMAWLQTESWQFAGLIAAVFLVGQTLEGYILTPRLVGETIGMHPLWVFFAVLAGGSLAGIVGMLVAIPLAACIGVLVEFAITRYKDGPYYQPTPPAPDTKSNKKPEKRRAL